MEYAFLYGEWLQYASMLPFGNLDLMSAMGPGCVKTHKKIFKFLNLLHLPMKNS